MYFLLAVVENKFHSINDGSTVISMLIGTKMCLTDICELPVNGTRWDISFDRAAERAHHTGSSRKLEGWLEQELHQRMLHFSFSANSEEVLGDTIATAQPFYVVMG